MKIRTAVVVAAIGVISAVPVQAQNRVLYLDGVDDYLQISRPVSDSFTLEVWINLQTEGVTNTTPAKCTPIYDNHYNHGDEDFGFYVAGTTPSLAVRNPWSVTSTVPLQVGSWTHIAAVRDLGAGESRIYINGQLTGTGDPRSGTLDQESTVWIGRNKRTSYPGGGGYEERLHAYVDECRFWNRALTQGEIQTNLFEVLSGSESGLVTYLNFDGDDFEDETSAANHATAYGSPTIIQTNTFDSDLVITAATVGDVVGVEFETLSGQWYELEYNTNLITTNWTDAGLRVLGDGGSRWFFDPAGFTPMKFYRVVEE